MRSVACRPAGWAPVAPTTVALACRTVSCVRSLMPHAQNTWGGRARPRRVIRRMQGQFAGLLLVWMVHVAPLGLFGEVTSLE
eukprot:6847599-Prymnesium_polylepis.1